MYHRHKTVFILLPADSGSIIKYLGAIPPSVEGGKIEAPSRVGYREGYSLPSRLGGMGSVVNSPSRIWAETLFGVF